MCGICGFTGPPDHDLLREMTAALVHRGPDDYGYLEDAEVSLGVRRLSVIDVPGGHQPIQNEDGTIWTVYNGEIYNFRALREELGSKGHDFGTASDTETIVHAYEQYDLKFVNHLSGMFALALWDQRRKRLVLVRDRIGMKPLYYIQREGGLAFASEIKSLLVHPEVHRVPDAGVLRLILGFGYSPDERTPFRGILKLPPGHLMIYEKGRVNTQGFWRKPLPSAFETDIHTVTGTLERTLRDAVKSHLVSEVPVGVMLSGGLDSTILTVLAREVLGERLQTFTFCYAEEPTSTDRTFAADVASHLSTDHHEITLSGEDMVRLIPLVVYHHDEPKPDAASFPTLAAAFHIKKRATVVLVGEGADEQLGGYVSHNYFAKTRMYRGLVPRLAEANGIRNYVDNSPRLRRHIRTLEYFGALRNANQSLRIMNSPIFTDWDFDRSADLAFTDAVGGVNPGQIYEPLLHDVGTPEFAMPSRVDLTVYIPNDISMKIDKMTMAASVEARMPFLDTALLEWTPRIDPRLKTKGGVPKFLLRRAFAGSIPPKILRRPKQTIRVPVARWIRDNFDVFRGIAEDGVEAKRSPVSRGAFERIAARSRVGNDLRAAHQLLALSVIETWYRLYVDPDSWRASPPGLLTR